MAKSKDSWDPIIFYSGPPNDPNSKRISPNSDPSPVPTPTVLSPEEDRPLIAEPQRCIPLNAKLDENGMWNPITFNSPPESTKTSPDFDFSSSSAAAPQPNAKPSFCITSDSETMESEEGEKPDFCNSATLNVITPTAPRISTPPSQAIGLLPPDPIKHENTDSETPRPPKAYYIASTL